MILNRNRSFHDDDVANDRWVLVIDTNSSK